MTDDTASNDDTEPGSTGTVDPDRPAAAGAPDSALPPDGAPARSDGAGVAIPSWLAGALVVVLALVIGAAGFAIGRATADDSGFEPIVSTEGRGPGVGPGGRGGPRVLPGGPDGMPGFPGEGRGGRGEVPRGGPGLPGGHDHRHDDGDGEDDADGEDDGEDDAPELPGT